MLSLHTPPPRTPELMKMMEERMWERDRNPIPSRSRRSTNTGLAQSSLPLSCSLGSGNMQRMALFHLAQGSDSQIK